MKKRPVNYSLYGVRLLTLIGCLFFFTPTLRAQWLERATRRLQNGIPSSAQLANLKLERAIRRQLAHAPTPIPQAVLQAPKALLRVKERQLPYAATRIPASAFVIEEQYQGKTYLWGVTASHYGFQKPALKKSFFTHTPVPFQVQGHVSGSDVSIFALPPEFAARVTPLKLATKPAVLGEQLYSWAFFDGDLQYETNRAVQEITPLRLITSLQVDKEISREGACGAPLLNAQGEVVGMHVGSSLSQQIGFVIPLSQIRQTLEALHHPENTRTPLVFQGKELLSLQVNEGIEYIDLFKQGKRVFHLHTFHQEKLVDYAHLESLLPNIPFDELHIVIHRMPFSTQEQNKQDLFTFRYHVVSTEMLR